MADCLGIPSNLFGDILRDSRYKRAAYRLEMAFGGFRCVGGDNAVEVLRLRASTRSYSNTYTPIMPAKASPNVIP